MTIKMMTIKKMTIKKMTIKRMMIIKMNTKIIHLSIGGKKMIKNMIHGTGV